MIYRGVLARIPAYWWVALVGWVSKAITASIQLVSIRYILGLLGEQDYSVFVLLAALSAWAALSDFGIGNSLQNFISEKRAQGEDAKVLLLTSFFLLVICLFFCILSLYFLSPFLAERYLIGAINYSLNDKSFIFFVCVSIFVVTVLGGVAYKVLFAYQLGWLAHLLPALGSLIGFFLVYTVDIRRLGDPLLCSFVLFYGPSALIAVVTSICLLCRNISPIPMSMVRGYVILLWEKAPGFWLFTLLAALVLQIDAIVMSQWLSASEIVLYSILSKLWGLGLFVYAALLQALWPVCTELKAKREFEKLRGIAFRYAWGGVIFMLFFSICFYLISDKIFMLLGASLEMPFLTWCLFTLYFILRAWTDTFAMLLMSMGFMKPFWLFVPCQALLSISVQWILVQSLGVNGVLLGLIISFVFTVSIGLAYCFCKEIELKTN